MVVHAHPVFLKFLAFAVLIQICLNPSSAGHISSKCFGSHGAKSSNSPEPDDCTRVFKDDNPNTFISFFNQARNTGQIVCDLNQLESPRNDFISLLKSHAERSINRGNRESVEIMCQHAQAAGYTMCASVLREVLNPNPAASH